MSLRRRLGVAMAVLVALLALGTFGYRFLVGGTLLQGLYMTVITLTTVGYGEVVPGLDSSTVGRLFTMLLILFGMGLLVYVASTTTAFVVEGELTNLIRRRKMNRQIEALRGHIVVCGVGATGAQVVRELHAVGDAFVVVEHSQERIDRAGEHTPLLFLQGDATDEAVLVKAGVERARGLVTALSSDKDNLFVAFTARQLNPRARIVARGVDPGIRDRLLRAGANAVVFPNHIGGLRMVSELLRPHVVSFLDRMLRSAEATWRFEEVEVTDVSAAKGRTLGELRIPERIGLPVLALSEGEGERVTYYPPPDTVLRERARLVVLAERSQVERLRRLVGTGSAG